MNPADHLDFGNTRLSENLSEDAALVARLYHEWKTGTGQKNRFFGPHTLFTRLAKTHWHMKLVRAKIEEQLRERCMEGNSSSFADNYHYRLEGVMGLFKALADYVAGLEGNMVNVFLGSYDMDYKVYDIDCCEEKAMAGFTLTNTTSYASATKIPIIHYGKGSAERNRRVNDEIGPEGPMSPTTQTAVWTEPIVFEIPRPWCPESPLPPVWGGGRRIP